MLSKSEFQNPLFLPYIVLVVIFLFFIKTIFLSDTARTYLQPHYGNGVFGNVYLSAGQH